MVETISRKAFISINNVWFIGGQIYDTSAASGQIQFLHGVKENNIILGNLVREREQKTLITDLLEDELVLWQRISKTYRNEIRRCERENRSVVYLTSEEIISIPNLIDEFEKTYNNMFASKGMKDRFNRKLFCAYANSNALVVSVAYKGDEPVVFHSYIVDEKNARFWYSCSNFRENKTVAEEIGRLNKFLHWKDMQIMKGMGIESYDWGGIGLSEETKGIAEFKRKFGGTEIVYKNCIYVKNRILHIILNYYLNRKQRG